MNVGMYYNNNDVRVEEMPMPEIGSGEILIKTECCGICGTDVLEWYRLKTAPRVLGHEATGVITKIGEGVANFKIGNRVFVAHHVPCNECYYCLRGYHTSCDTLHRTNFYPGGFSEYIRVPEINVRLGTYCLPENVSFEQGVFIEPLGCVLRAQRLVKLTSKDTVLIIGAGISGLLHVKSAIYDKSARVVAVDINEHRLNQALKYGADYTVNAGEDVPLALKRINENRLADVVILCTGATQAVNLALGCIDKGGRILFFATPPPNVAVTFPINEFWRNEIMVMTSYGASPDDMRDALRLISSRNIIVEDMISHTLPLREIGHGFKLVAEAKDSLKVIIKPND